MSGGYGRLVSTLSHLEIRPCRLENRSRSGTTLCSISIVQLRDRDLDHISCPRGSLPETEFQS